MIQNIISFVINIFNIIGPSIPYYDQLNLLKKQNNLNGFSKETSLIIIIAMYFKTLFLFDNKKSKVIFLQSIVLLIINLLLYNHCWLLLKFNFKTMEKHMNKIIVYFLIFFIFYNFYRNSLLNIIIGIISVIFESIVPLPTLYKNYKNKKNIKYLNLKIVLNWILGDLFKLYYYLKIEYLLYFFISSLILLVFDFIIIYQYFKYNKNK